VPSGAELRVETARKDLSLTLNEMDDGSWVIVELPGFTTTAGGAEKTSLADLRGASQTAWFKDGDRLWVKLVVDNSAGQSVIIGRPGAGVSTVGPGPGGAFAAGAKLDVSRAAASAAAPKVAAN
jgi:cell migration-inducing and hyaluronan-binding protein